MNKWLLLLPFLTSCASTAVDSKPHLMSAMSFAQPMSVIVPQGSITVVPKDIGLQWASSESTDEQTVSGYNIYYGTESRSNNDGTWPSNYSNVINAGNTTNLPLLELSGGITYFLAATAVDQNGVETDFSEETIYTTPLVMDVTFRFNQPVTDVTLQWSPDLSQWSDLGTIPTNGVWRLTGDPSVPRFYRGKATSTP